MTHTVAKMAVSNSTYAEISTLLFRAGYNHAFKFQANGNYLIDLTGIGIVRSEEGIADENACRSAYDNWYHKVRAEHSYDEWVGLWMKGETPSQKYFAAEAARTGGTGTN